MTHHVLDMPITEAQARALRVGDTVTLEKTLFGIRDATLIAMFDGGRATRFDLKGHAVIHTAPNVKKVPVTNENASGYEPLCIGTTTSQRMERFTRPLMEQNGVRIIIGKGGMGPETLHFLEACIRNTPVMVTPEHARMVMEVYMAADASAESNQPVALPMAPPKSVRAAA